MKGWSALDTKLCKETIMSDDSKLVLHFDAMNLTKLAGTQSSETTFATASTFNARWALSIH